MRRCEVRWAPAKHRNLHGEKDDHGLLLSVWKWRIRCPKSKPVKDFSKLTETKTDSEGKQIPNEVLIEFDKAVSQEQAPRTVMPSRRRRSDTLYCHERRHPARG